mmetsp:Transcript_46217/g.91116  ORF Transcript_46217/g.91116 Transcript_46217/m.91116 type:complete len:82 (-) Transcript_46217:2447-2692(-)
MEGRESLFPPIDHAVVAFHARICLFVCLMASCTRECMSLSVLKSDQMNGWMNAQLYSYLMLKSFHHPLGRTDTGRQAGRQA